MVMSSDILLESLRLNIAEELKMYLFKISLLDATIQDGSIRERNDVWLTSNPKSKMRK